MELNKTTVVGRYLEDIQEISRKGLVALIWGMVVIEKEARVSGFRDRVFVT